MKFSNLILFFFTIEMECLETIETGATLVVSRSVEAKTEDLLIEFMIDLKKFGFETLRHHRLLVLGKEKNTLQTAKVILESGTPYFISTEAEAMVLPPNFSADSIVLFFIDGFTDFEIDSVFAKLPKNYKCRALIISMKEDRTEQSVATTILSAVRMKLRNVKFARYDGQVIKIYGRIANASCEQEIKLMNKWIPKKGFVKYNQVLGHDLALNERGCPMFVSTFEILPTTILREDENESLHISGGIEGDLVRTIAEYLNLTPVVKLPSLEEKFLIVPNGTILGIIGDVAREEASFGIGQIRPTTERATLVDSTVSYNYECMLWTVPLRNKYNYSVLTSEFSPGTWAIVILSVSLCCGLAYVAPKLNIGYGSSLDVLRVFAMTLNYAIPRQPTGVLGKLCVLLYLNYSRIISIAYSTSLASILTTSTPEPGIVDIEGIISAGLRTAGLQSSRELLANETPRTGAIAELNERFEVITSVEVALERIANRGDIAYLRPQSSISYFAKKLSIAGKPVKFYSLPECLILYYPVMVTPKGSRLTGEVNHVITRLFESGLYGHWKSLYHASKPWIRSLMYNSNSLSRLKSIFYLYLCCLVPAFLALAAEIIVFKLDLDWSTR